MNLGGVVLIVLAIAMGAFSAWSTDQWLDAAQQSEADTPRLKKEFLDSAGLRQLHHEIYQQVGEQAWENRVKPQFLSDVTTAVVRDTGNVLPDSREVIDWVRAHPDEARRLLKAAAGIK
jgi:hypothetical protein